MMQNSSTTNAIKQELQLSEMYFLVVISIFQSVIGTVGNVITLATILLYGRLHQMPSNFLLLNLATVDLLSCVIFLPLHIYNLHQASLGRISRFFYHAQCLFHLFSNGNAIFAITVDRFIAVAFSLRYKSIVTKRRIVVAIILSWLMPLLFSVTFLYHSSKRLPGTHTSVIRTRTSGVHNVKSPPRTNLLLPTLSSCTKTNK